MLQYLQETLGIEASLSCLSEKGQFPFYLTNTYHFSILKIFDQEYIYLEIIDKLPAINHIKKHVKMIYEISEMLCIIGMSKIKSYQRKILIEEKISFIVPFNQLYMPCLGISLTERMKKMVLVAGVEKFTPATQLLFLHLLYDESFYEINPTDAANKIQVTKMTMTRAFAELQGLGLVTAKAMGTKKVFTLAMDKRSLFEKGRKYLRSPVVKKIYTDDQELLEKCLVSGLQALSQKTMLSPPRYQIRAIHKDVGHLKKIQGHDQDYLEKEGAYELELWDYDPTLFSKNGVVDPASLVAALQNSSDERIQIEINEFLKKVHLW